MITKHFPVLFFMNFHNSVPRVVLFFAFERTERVLERECSRERGRERERERERESYERKCSITPKVAFSSREGAH